MKAYVPGFLALAALIRSLHDKYKQDENKHILHGQIKNLRFRLKLIQNMQALGVLSFIFCIVSMYFIHINWLNWANLLFALALISFTSSLLLSLLEIQKSNKALELQLSDMEDLDNPSVIEYIKKKFEKE